MCVHMCIYYNDVYVCVYTIYCLLCICPHHPTIVRNGYFHNRLLKTHESMCCKAQTHITFARIIIGLGVSHRNKNRMDFWGPVHHHSASGSLNQYPTMNLSWNIHVEFIYIYIYIYIIIIIIKYQHSVKGGQDSTRKHTHHKHTHTRAHTHHPDIHTDLAFSENELIFYVMSCWEHKHVTHTHTHTHTQTHWFIVIS